MKKLNKNEMLTINGGGAGSFIAWAFGIGTFIAFLSGVFDGFTRPLRCN